jgi:hypothetical protein
VMDIIDAYERSQQQRNQQQQLSLESNQE